MATTSGVHFYLVSAHGLSEKYAQELVNRYRIDVLNGMQFGHPDEQVGLLLLRQSDHICSTSCMRERRYVEEA